MSHASPLARGAGPRTLARVTKAVADGDGWGDLVLACFDLTNQLVVRRGTAAGFTEPLKIALPSPIAVALRDLNGDGKLDAVACNLEQGALSLLQGRGDGAFDALVTVPVSPHPSALAVADLDGSGLADVAVPDIGDDAIRVFLNPAVTAVPDDGGRESVIKRSGREGGWLGGRESEA